MADSCPPSNRRCFNSIWDINHLLLVLFVILNVSVLSLRRCGEESNGILCGLEAGSVVDTVNLVYEVAGDSWSWDPPQ